MHIYLYVHTYIDMQIYTNTLQNEKSICGSEALDSKSAS